MSATTPTEAHRQLALRLDAMLWHGTPQTSAETEAAAQLIADSEERAVATLTAERDQLHAQLRALNLICGTNDANKFETWVDRANARAERAETVALAKWNGALERAMKAEADLAALGQCHDDNCRAVVKFAADLAAERARLDWVFRNCKVTAHDYTTGNLGLYSIHDREDLGAAMKEDAK